MNKTVWIGFGVLLLIVAGSLIFATRGKKEDNNQISVSSSTPAAIGKVATATPQTMEKKTYSQPPAPLSSAEIKGKKATIKTNEGDIVFELFDDAPMAASNFMFLARDKFYDSLTFHRRVEGFVIQGGDPRGDGTGGPGYKFQDEKVTRNYDRGIVAMANSGPDTNGSQFFIMLADNPLPKNYTIFGKVISGMDVADKIQVGDVIDTVTIE